MTETFTVAIREKGRPGRYQYYGVDGRVRTVKTYCKPLSRSDAELAVRLLSEGAQRVGRPIECKIVSLTTE